MDAYCSHKAKVAGSTPVAATIYFIYYKRLLFSHSLLERVGNALSAHGVTGNTTGFGSVIGGSSPSVLTLVIHYNFYITFNYPCL